MDTTHGPMRAPHEPGHRNSTRGSKPAMSVGALIAILRQYPQDADVNIRIDFPARGISVVKGGAMEAKVRFVHCEETPFGSVVRVSPTAEPQILTKERRSHQRGRG